MAYRALDVRVAKIDVFASRLVIRQNSLSTRAQKGSYNTVFRVDTNTIITNKENRSLKFTDLKVGNRVSVDFIKTKDKKFLVKGISILN